MFRQKHVAEFSVQVFLRASKETRYSVKKIQVAVKRQKCPSFIKEKSGTRSEHHIPDFSLSFVHADQVRQFLIGLDRLQRSVGYLNSHGSGDGVDTDFDYFFVNLVNPAD